MTKSDTLVLDTPTREWVAAFNRARGWKSLSGTNSAKPDAKDLRSSPKRQLREERAMALGGDRTSLVREVIAQQDARLQELDDIITNAGADTDMDALTRERKELLRENAADKADLAIVERVDAHVAQLRAVEGDLRGDLSDVRAEIRRLDSEASVVDYDSLDQDLLAQFRQQHVMVQGNIENARAEVMKMTSAESGKTLRYAVINGLEYKILFGMLEQAILMLGGGDLPAAIARVAQTQTQLNTFRNARTGATSQPALVSEYGNLDAPINDVENKISMLQSKGMPAAAEQFEVRLEALSVAIKQGIAAQSPDVEKTFLKDVTDLGTETMGAVNQAEEVLKIWADMRTDIASMRANGHLDDPDPSQIMLQDCTRMAVEQVHVSITLAETREAADDIRARLEQTKIEDLRLSKLKPADMQQELARLEGQYEEFFKKKRNGEIATQKDTKSREKKGKKKNSNLPRGALEEIELQMLAAKQLVQSDSVDALKTADAYLTGINNFIEAIKDDPKIYVHLAEEFTRVEKKIAKTKKLFPLYEPGRLLDLKAELDALRANHLTRAQADVTRDTDALRERVLVFRAEMLELQTFKRALASQADDVDSIIKAIGKKLEKDKSNGTKFDGYYGPEVARMATIRDQIAERSPASLKQAASGLVEINGNLGWLRTLLKKAKAGDDLHPTEQEHVDALISVARSGQMEHDANEAKKQDFKTGISKLADAIKDAKAMLNSVKADVSDVTALESERDGLKAEIKKSGKYIDGLDKLQGLDSRIKQITSEAKAAKAILDPDLATATANCAQALLLFTEKLGTFVEDVIEPEGETDSGPNQLDQPPFNGGAIRNFFAQLKGSLEQVNISELRTQSARVADRNLQTDQRKIARKIALQELRKLMALFESFAPMQHFRTHPFANGDASTRMQSAHKTLPLLEKRLLTAIKD